MDRKITVWIFQPTNCPNVYTRISGHGYERQISWEKSLLIETQNNFIKTNYIKAKIDNSQQNGKCKLHDNKDETINQTISECCKLANKNTRISTRG